MGQSLLSRLKHQYIITQVNRAKIPDFTESGQIREKLVFSGKVQNVGFRFQAKLMAERLELFGWVKNRENGDVEMEIQGPQKKITFLIEYMKSRKRMKISKVTHTTLFIKADSPQLFEIV
ncbi:acylphosphatase [Enterococcus sp. LJL51]|uniref:acylphosphatase n=1 Tax=Enterococcus sp. LJL51 TaxID=3416656 RepID=UPI003CF961CD